MGEEQTAVPPVIGVALLVVVVILLAVTTLLVFSPSIREPQHPGSYAIERSASSNSFELTVQAADSSVPLDVRVDGRYVTTFDPQRRRSIELTNVSAGDQIRFVTNETNAPRQSYIVYATTVSSAVGAAGPPGLLHPPEPPAPQGPRCLETAAQLRTIELDGDYKLCGDIDARETTQWEPIGDTDEPFTGSLDGNGHAIVGLTIEPGTATESMALFGYTTGTIRDLALRQATIKRQVVAQNTGQPVPRQAVLAGTNAGTIRDVSVSGTVTGTGDVGGIVARQTANGRLQNVTGAVDVRATGRARAIGGIVAVNEGTIAGATVTGAVIDAPRANATGGIAGVDRGEIQDSRLIDQTTIRKVGSGCEQTPENRSRETNAPGHGPADCPTRNSQKHRFAEPSGRERTDEDTEQCDPETGECESSGRGTAGSDRAGGPPKDDGADQPRGDGNSGQQGGSASGETGENGAANGAASSTQSNSSRSR